VYRGVKLNALEWVVAATGPSLTEEVAERCRGKNVIAVNDAWQLMPFAQVLYGPDPEWWVSSNPSSFGGDKWICTQTRGVIDTKRKAVIEKFCLNVIRLDNKPGFSTKPNRIHHGLNAGFQAINLAICFGAKLVRLVAFDMQVVKSRRHFFGDHPHPLTNINHYDMFIPSFEKAAELLPDDIEIINCTPGSALRCFPFGAI